MFTAIRRASWSLALLAAIMLVALALATSPVGAVSKNVILRLQAAVREKYVDPGDAMGRYTVFVYRDKAYATTRGVVKGVETVAVWEYVPDQWHCVFDYPMSESTSPQVTQRYRAYGFTAKMQNKMLSSPKPFPGAQP